MNKPRKSQPSKPRETKPRLTLEDYRRIIDTLPDAIIITRASDGTFLLANAAFYQRAGYTPEEVIGRTTTEINLYANPGGRERLLKKLADDGRVDTTETHFKSKDGSVADVLLSVRPIRIKGEACLLSTTTDITLIKKAQKALEESEAKHRTVLNNMEEGYYETDLAGNFTFFNEAMCRIHGYTAEELLGMNNRHYTTPDTARRMYCIFNEVYETQIPARIQDYELIKKDGTVKVAEVSASLLKNSDGEPIGFFGISRDVSQTRQLEAQLLQAQKMEAVGTLAGGISHDFNNLLQAIMGYCQILIMKKPEDDPDMRKLKGIEKAAQRATELTAQLLAFSRKVELHPRRMDLNREVKQVEKLLKRTFLKMIDVELHLADDLQTINADPVQLEQVILNIGINARDAMPEGGLLILETANVHLDDAFCRSHLGLNPGPHVLLTIIDSGHGMDDITVTHMFEPFYTTKEVGKGSGLGLAMAYGIIKNHGGLIVCDSSPGRGTTFRIYLPAVEAVPEAALGKPDTNKTPMGRGETVLVVDDEELLRDLAEDTLTGHGYQVLKAENGETALSLYKENRADIALIILDMIMPGMGGKKCLSALMALNPKAKIIVASGYAMDRAAQDDIMKAAKGFVKKPYDVGNMLKVIRDVLSEEA